MRDIDRYYRTLELEPGASPEELKRAYRDLVKVWHPDRFPDDTRLQQKAQDRLKEINEAYERLQSVRPSPRPRTRRAEPRPQRPASRPRQDERGSRRSEMRRFPVRAGIFLFLTAAVISVLGSLETVHLGTPNPLLSPSGVIYPATGRYFTVGSTKDEVLAVQGTPTRMILSTDGSTWYYGHSKVYFAGDHVVRWDISPQYMLKVRNAGTLD